MTHVLTLISPPRTPHLSEQVTAAIARILPGAGPPAWLTENHAACDIPFRPSQPRLLDHLERACRKELGNHEIDLAIQPVDGRRKSLLVADMDSTVIQQECIDELGRYLGIGDEIAGITERAMRGELDFEAALTERVGYLEGIEVSVIDTLLADVITLTPGAAVLTDTMRRAGAHTCLVSGGFTAFAQTIRQKAGFDEARANVLEVRNGKLTGHVRPPILGRQAKHDILVELSTARGLDLSKAIAVGDGANDLEMIAAAGCGVAFHAAPEVAAASSIRIEHGDLTALLYVQGYFDHEFVAA